MVSVPDLLAAWARAWEWIAGREAHPPTAVKRPAFADAYDQVYAALDPAELQDDAEPLDDAALAQSLFRVDGRSERFLGFYSERGARLALERYGFLDLLRERGFDPVVSGDASDPDEHRLRIHDGVVRPDRLLIELGVGVRHVVLPNDRPARFLFVNWLQMQDPDAVFADEARPLPDQRHPGLGLFIHFSYLLKLIADRIGCDGLMNHPSHPYNGVLYGKVCHFVDPEIEGRFRALERDVGADDLVQLTHDLAQGNIVDAEGEPFVWEPAPQVLPVSRAARSWFRSEAYLERVEAELMRVAYRRLA